MEFKSLASQRNRPFVPEKRTGTRITSLRSEGLGTCLKEKIHFFEGLLCSRVRSLEVLLAVRYGLVGGGVSGSRKIMRAFVRSYGEISTLTRSPGTIRIKFLRILPEICASTMCPFDNFSRNIVPGKTSTTTPSVTIDCSFDTERPRLLSKVRLEINPSSERGQSLASFLVPRKRWILQPTHRADP
jgi:hypothetical protein